MEIENKDFKFSNNIRLIIAILVVLALVAIGTFAWLKSRLDATRLVLTLGGDNGLVVTLKPYKIEATLKPVADYTSGIEIDVEANNRSSESQAFRLFYVIDTISQELQCTDFKYKVRKSTDGGNTYTDAIDGDFSNITNMNNFLIYADSVDGNRIYKYKVYIWIQELNKDQSSLQGTSFNGKIMASFVGGLPMAPVLDSGIIPVTIANDGTVTAISKYSETWYNYDNQEWANAVLTTSTNRSLYQTISTSVSSSTVIPSSEILAYYVWIPRYSYKIWTTSTSGTVHEIDIKFVSRGTKELGTTIGQYRTHPAFTFDGEELAGFWVGKFEISNTAGGTSNLSCSNYTCNNSNNIRIIPNTVSLRSNTIASFFFGIGSMTKTDNVFGLTGSNTDSHAIKNTEWGAVAYLTQSTYGVNDEVRINNSGSYVTGCGATTSSATAATTCQIQYGNVTSYPQSTTGNITGVFDMSGGAGEYTMGNYNDTVKGGFSTLPDSKYYNTYTFTSVNSCTVDTCGGHALNETAGWYGDTVEDFAAGKPWYLRGGTQQDEAASGIFFFQTKDGGGTLFRGARASITVKSSSSSSSQSSGSQQQTSETDIMVLLANSATMDNVASTYVTSSTGIDFSQISSDTNGKGVYIRAGTENDIYPIYYYRGAVTNNNVLFGNFCWKIVRTTETGGVKLIYSGTPTSGSCVNTTAQLSDSSIKFSANYTSPADVGYMYGTRYTYLIEYSSSLATPYKYGNRFSYSGGTYTLVDTITSTGTWSTDYNTLNNNHYTCFNDTGVCSHLYYIYYTNRLDGAYFITLTGGKGVETALDEMFSNTTSSTIKSFIDNWYTTNLATNEANLEDTVWCNDREIYQLNGWNPDGGDTTKFLYFKPYERAAVLYYPRLTCNRTNDAFTKSSSNGNGSLSNPIGLLTADEVMLAGGRYYTGNINTGNSTYYLYSGMSYWLGSPFYWSMHMADECYVYYSGNLYADYVSHTYGARPAVSLKPGATWSGEGTSDNPYTVNWS